MPRVCLTHHDFLVLLGERRTMRKLIVLSGIPVRGLICCVILGMSFPALGLAFSVCQITELDKVISKGLSSLTL